MSDRPGQAPPQSITIYVCDRCPRREFSSLALRRNHMWGGRLCGGTVQKLTYVLSDSETPKQGSDE